MDEKRLLVNREGAHYHYNSRKDWYALYVRPNHEKKVSEKLEREGIEVFLPLRTTLRQWSDRKKKVYEPLFRCYVFVRIHTSEHAGVLYIPGAVRFVTCGGSASAIPETQIQLIRDLLEQHVDISETEETFTAGSLVQVKTGALMGTRGWLVDFAGKKRVIIRIEQINRALLINVPVRTLKKL
jgi:transcriptional antiterminator RfaH